MLIEMLYYGLLLERDRNTNILIYKRVGILHGYPNGKGGRGEVSEGEREGLPKSLPFIL